MPRLVPALSLLWVAALFACGSADKPGSTSTQESSEAPSDTPLPAAQDDAPEPGSAARRAQEPRQAISLACGRGQGQIPRAFALVEDRDEPCVNAGYPFEVEGHGYAGGGSTHRLLLGECEMELRAGEQVGESGPPAPVVEQTSAGWNVLLNTPDNTLFWVAVENCEADARRVAEMLAATLQLEPLRAPSTEAQVQLTSAGHGMTLTVPEGFLLASRGGQSDYFETAYSLQAESSETVLTVYTGWVPDADPNRPLRGFNETVLGRRLRGQGTEFDPITDEECRMAKLRGPEARIAPWLTLCGPRSGDATLLDVLRNARYTRPPASSANPT